MTPAGYVLGSLMRPGIRATVLCGTCNGAVYAIVNRERVPCPNPQCVNGEIEVEDEAENPAADLLAPTASHETARTEES